MNIISIDEARCFFVLAIAMLALCACRGASDSHADAASSSTSLDEVRHRVAAFELCKTSEQDVINAVGTSMRDGRVGRLRIRSWRFSNDPERILAVALDQRGIVVDINWDAPGVAMWSPRDQCASQTP